MDGLLSLLLFAGLFFLMMRFGCGSHVGHGGHGHRHGGDGAAAEGAMYTCPMHQEIRQTYPGSCPRCGMQLEAESTTKGGQSS